MGFPLTPAPCPPRLLKKNILFLIFVHPSLNKISKGSDFFSHDHRMFSLVSINTVYCRSIFFYHLSFSTFSGWLNLNPEQKQTHFFKNQSHNFGLTIIDFFLILLWSLYHFYFPSRFLIKSASESSWWKFGVEKHISRLLLKSTSADFCWKAHQQTFI